MTSDESTTARDDGRALATAVLATVPNHDERHTRRHEFIEALENAP